MSRMVKCCATGVHGKSGEFYKIGRDWFKDHIISSSAKDKIIEIIMSDYLQ